MDTASKNGAALKPAIVVTGASSGIGRDIARLAAADRCFLLLLGRSPQALDELVAELTAAGAQAAPLPIDLLDPHAPDRVERALHGGPIAFVNAPDRRFADDLFGCKAEHALQREPRQDRLVGHGE